MRRLVFPAVMAAALVVASAAQAAGLNLGTRNPTHGAAKSATRIVGNLDGGALQARNIGGGPAFTFMASGILGGKILVGKGGDNVRPFTTNAHGVATGLNADMLDGHNASDFVLKSALTSTGPSGDFLPLDGKAADSNLLDGLDSTAFLGAHATADNSNQLGGHPSSFFLPTTGTAADSNQLGGHPSSFFLPTTGTAADSAKLGGQSASFYEPSSKHVSLTPALMDKGDAPDVPASAPGFVLFAECVDATGSTEIDLILRNTGTADAYVGINAAGGSTSTTVSSGGGDVTVFSDTNTGGLQSGGVLPYPISIVTDAGIYQGVLTIGTGVEGHDCFVSGSLSS